MDHLRCVVERITYQNEDNGFSVIKCRAKGYSDLVTVVGNMPDVHVGSVLTMDGQWRVDSKYGRQFAAEKWEETLPATTYGIEKYLGSGLIKGVGPKFAKRIVQQFGKDTLEVIEADPDRLIEVDGIGRKRVECIKKGWQEQKEIKNIMLFLQSHDVSTAHAARIYKTYGNDSIEIVKENPYRLADDIWGIGFRTADQIARKMGIEKDRFMRLRSGILYTLNQLSEEGHCYAVRGQLVETAARLLEVDEPELEITLDEMLRTSDLILERGSAPEYLGSSEHNQSSIVNVQEPKATQGLIDYAAHLEGVFGQQEREQNRKTGQTVSEQNDKVAIYLPPFYYAEVGCAKRLQRLLCSDRSRKIETDRLMERVKSNSRISYDEVQLQAIREAISSKVMILTGGPGTGKTTTTLGIIQAYRMAGCQIILAAPTGRAAKRMSEATGMEAKTIHRLLEYKPSEGYQRNENHPLEADVLILDECSMIDMMLMYNLLKALPESMTLILVGDTDQLPSVGAGNVLKDIIASECVPVVRLTRIFRQAQGSRIIMNAHRINHGQMPDLRGGREADFFFAEKETNEEVAELLVRYCTQNLPKYYKADAFRDIQVLTPMQRGVCGAANLNQLLQEAMNPSPIFLKRGGTQYRLHDKVMQIRNDYDKEVFNGDIGIIVRVDTEESELSVDFDGREVTYDITELDELVLAYATTIHKAQGSEYPIVVMPFTMSHYVMLQRNLLYTGVTRAKKILVMIGEKKAIAYAVRNEKTTQRNTKLAQRLRESILGENAETAKNSGNILENSENILQKKPPEIPLMAAEAKAVYGKRPHVATNDANLDRSAADSAVLHRNSSINPTVSHQNSSSAVPDTAYRRHLFDRLAQSKFRSSFYLRAADRVYVKEKGMDTIRSHAQDFVRKRLAPEVIPNDGKQTPMKGHPVFIAQHATGCCCRGCLAKWHGITTGCELTEEQQEYIVDVLMEWIRRQMER